MHEGDSSSLYGQGRAGQKRMAEDYGEDREDDQEGREERAKKDAMRHKRHGASRDNSSRRRVANLGDFSPKITD